MTFRLLPYLGHTSWAAVRCGADLFDAAIQLATEIATDLANFKLSPVNAVVASGDFTFRAGRDEFEAASRFFKVLSGRLGLPLSNFLFVPGNHDVAWYPPSRPNQLSVPNLREDAKDGYETFLRRMHPGCVVAPICNADILLFKQEIPPVIGTSKATAFAASRRLVVPFSSRSGSTPIAVLLH